MRPDVLTRSKPQNHWTKQNLEVGNMVVVDVRKKRGLWDSKWSERWSSAEVSVGEDHGGHQGPDVHGQAHPAGGDLNPHCWPLAGYGVVCIRAVGCRTHRSLFTHNLTTHDVKNVMKMAWALREAISNLKTLWEQSKRVRVMCVQL